MGFKSVTMALVITTINIGICLSNYIYCRKRLNINIKYNGFDQKLFKTIFGYSFFIFLGVMVDKINWSLDQFILGLVSGTTAISLYAVASSINNLFVNLSTGISGVMLPKVSKMVANKATNQDLTNEFIKVGRIQYYLIFLLASGIVLFGKQFIIAWAGIDYEKSYYITIALVLPICIPLIQNLGISIMQAKNMHKFRSILLGLIAILNILISIPLAKIYGGLGCAIGTGLSLLVGNGVIINIYYHHKVGINVIEFTCFT
jgi:O-antigen/teichoic acid export membrane protein